MASWQVQEAKNRLSELLNKAVTEGPQTITKHGAEKFIVVSIDEYRRLLARQKSLGEHLLGFPKAEGFADLVDRDRDRGRDFDFGND